MWERVENEWAARLIASLFSLVARVIGGIRALHGFDA